MTFPAVLNLADINGTNGFRIDGETRGDRFGFSASGAGDLNGDGIDDIIVGAIDASFGGDQSGASYVIFGRATRFSASFNLAIPNGIGWRMEGVNRLSGLGQAVSGVGDVNGDGINDWIVAATNQLLGLTAYTGASYVVFGSETRPRIFDVSTLDGSNGFRVDGPIINRSRFTSVSEAGDINGDGFDDLIIGSVNSDNNGRDSGSSYIIFGRGDGFDSIFDVSSVDGSNGFRIDGAASGDRSGRSVSGVGDVNGDGFDDFIVGAFNADNGSNNTGSSYVVFGREEAFDPVLNLSILDGSNGFRLDGTTEWEESGLAVSGAGDVNGDGIDDIIIGAPNADINGVNSGVCYIVFGQSDGFSATFNLADLDGSNGFRVDGFSASTEVGRSVSSAGDINKDGFDDVVIGAGFKSNSLRSGSSYIIFGQATGFAAAVDLASLNGLNGFRIDGVSLYDNIGLVVSNAGDMNHDGVDDLLLSSPYIGTNGDYSGAAYVIFGWREGAPSAYDDVLTGTQNVDEIRALTGNDEVRGLGSNDRLFGDAGSDRLFGGGGNDLLMGGTDSDNLRGDDGDDHLKGGDGNDTLNGGHGSDRLEGQDGGDRLFGGEGNDRVFGGDGRDRLEGQDGDDLLFGGDDRDTLIGGRSSDTFDGGRGNDLITTGSGQDVIILRLEQGLDRVTDFQNNSDKIDLVGIRFGQLTLIQNNDDVLLRLEDTNLLRLENIRVASIDRSDFI